jgi:hypothetical protein
MAEFYTCHPVPYIIDPHMYCLPAFSEEYTGN